MNSAEISHPAAGQRTPPPLLRWGVWIENAVVIFALAVMTVLPLLDCLSYALKTFLLWLTRKMPAHQHTLNRALEIVSSLSISGSEAWVKHGTLIVGLIGAAVAARENRLLSLATATILPAGWPRVVARIIASAVGAAVAAFLCFAAVQFVRSEFPQNTQIAYGVPVWTIELALPVGFALIALSVLYHSADHWRWRWISPLLAVGIVCLFLWAPIEQDRMILPAFIVLLAATLLGTPLFAVLGGATLILFWADGSPIASIPLDHYSLVTHASLPMIPLFTLAGYFLAEGGASGRLVRLFSALFGSVRGGPAIVTALLCAFFTSFTGASGVTILALGGVLMPILLAARYSDRAALGLLTGAGSLGMLFPPCLPPVLYAIIANLPIQKIYLGALLPGCLLVIMTAILGIWIGPKAPAKIQRQKFDAAEALQALWQAKWELLIPVVAVAGLFGGFATPVEAAAITAAYTFITQTFVCRDLSLRKDVPHVLTECGLVIGGVLLILGVAQGFTNYLIYAELPSRAIEWLTASVHSPYMFLLLLNLFLLIVGGLMDIYPAIVVVVPLIVPIGKAFGIDPVHLGVIFLANLEMGFMMPPLGINLLLSSYRFNRPIPQVYRAIVPILIVQFIGVLVITYVPAMTTFLPRWFGR